MTFIEYSNSKLMLKGVLFLQETHSAFKDEKPWRDNFKIVFFHTVLQIHAEFLLLSFGQIK